MALKYRMPDETKQSDYLKGVELIKRLNVSKFILNEEADLESYGKHTMSGSTEPRGYLTKMQISPQVHFNHIKIIPNNITHIITAFYIPEECERVNLYSTAFKFMENNREHFNVPSKYEGKNKELDVILNESRILPSETPLENLLCTSQTLIDDQFFYQQNSIIIEGCIYKRIVLCHPVVPHISMGHYDLMIQANIDVFYMEHIIIWDINTIVEYRDKKWTCVINERDVIGINVIKTE